MISQETVGVLYTLHLYMSAPMSHLTVLPLGKPLMLFKICVRLECRSGLCKSKHLAIPFETAGLRHTCTSLCHILIEVHEY